MHKGKGAKKLVDSETGKDTVRTLAAVTQDLADLYDVKEKAKEVKSILNSIAFEEDDNWEKLDELNEKYIKCIEDKIMFRRELQRKLILKLQDIFSTK